MKSAVSPRLIVGNRYSPGLRRRLLFLIIGNLLLVGFIFATTIRHEKASFLEEMSRFGPNVAPLVLAGLGLTGIICAGAIDLSIGAIIVVAGTVLGILYDRGASPGLCFAACFLTAVALSAWNGCLIRWLKIPSIIITLAGLAFYRGVALILAEVSIDDFGGQISLRGDAYHTPGKEYAGIILFVVLAVALVWDTFGKMPRTWLAVGNSAEASRLAGMHPGRVLHSAFLVGGLLLGLAAVIDVTNRLTIEPSRIARNFELDVIGAVVLGGTNIFGGEGSYAGTALGVCFLYFVGQAMLYAGVSEYWRTAVQGALIVAVIGFDCAIHRKRKLLEELR